MLPAEYRKFTAHRKKNLPSFYGVKITVASRKK